MIIQMTTLLQLFNEFRDKIAITLYLFHSSKASIARILPLMHMETILFFLDADDFLHPCIETLWRHWSVDESTFAVKCEALFVSSMKSLETNCYWLILPDFKISEFDSTTVPSTRLLSHQ